MQQEEETQVLAELPPKSPQPEQSEADSLTPAHQHVGEGWDSLLPSIIGAVAH